MHIYKISILYIDIFLYGKNLMEYLFLNLQYSQNELKYKVQS